MLKLRRKLLAAGVAGVLLVTGSAKKLLATGAAGVLLATRSMRKLLAAGVVGVLLVTGSAKKLLAAGVVGVILVAGVAACGGSSPSRQDVLSDLADEVIIPAYEDFLRDSMDLAEAVDDLCAIVVGASSAGTTAGDMTTTMDSAASNQSVNDSATAGSATNNSGTTASNAGTTAGDDASATEASAADSSAADASAAAEDALNAAHDALSATRNSWSFSEAMWVGPVMDRRSRAVIDWEIDAEQIDARIADTAFALTAENLATRVGADERGLGAAEHILGNPSAPDATLLKLANPRYCEYLQATTQVAAEEAQALQSDWTASFEGSQPYRSTFSDPDGSGLDDIVNGTINLLRKTSDMELRQALNGDLDTIQEGPLGRGVDDIAHHLAGIRAVLIGGVEVGNGGGTGGGGSESSRETSSEFGGMGDDTAGGSAETGGADSSSEGEVRSSGGGGSIAGEINGLSELLGGDITDRLTARLDAADAAVAALDAPLRASVSENPARVEAAYDALKALQMTVATEVVSKLGVAIGFSDTDGDSAG